MPSERDYIGPDPVAWVERLMDVAAGSAFTPDEKEIVRRRLETLRGELRVNRD